MEVKSVNIGEKRTILWRGKEVQTGIYKSPTKRPIYLGKEDVLGDTVYDRRYHGGVDKACYLYSADHYAFWKIKYPDLDFEDGMFGENITIKGLNERNLQIGDIYYLGEARVQISEPRQPCFKLGVRFETQKIVKDFIQHPFPGAYIRVIDEGYVQPGDRMQLSERLHDTIGLLDVWNLLYDQEPDRDLLEFAATFQHLSADCARHLQKRLASL